MERKVNSNKLYKKLHGRGSVAKGSFLFYFIFAKDSFLKMFHYAQLPNIKYNKISSQRSLPGKVENIKYKCADMGKNMASLVNGGTNYVTK